EELRAGTRTLQALEGLPGSGVIGAGGRKVLMLLKHRVELPSVRVQSHQVLLDLLLGRPRIRGHGGTSETALIRMRVRLTPWHPPISESAHSLAWAAEG